MKRKITLLLLALLCAFCCVLGLAACNKEATKITLNHKALSLHLKDTVTLVATVEPADASYNTVTWESTDTSVLIVDNNGNVIVVGYGSAAIIAYTREDKSLCDVCNILVERPPVKSIRLSQTELTLNVGEEATLQATIFPVEAAERYVDWTSHDPAVATVDNNGKVTAVSDGTTWIRASSCGVTVECTLTVLGGGYTNGLYYRESDDFTYYTVSDIGTATDTEIIIPASYRGLPVTAIGEAAFNGCNATSITVPDSITTIERAAFCNCSNLTTVVIGSGVTSLDTDAFNNCENLTTVTFSEDNTVYAYQDGIIYNKAKTEIKFLVSSAINGAVTIPDGVTSIGKYMFDSLDGLTSITIGNGVESIGEAAFWNCSNLESVTIGNNVTTIGDAAFSWCGSLTSINIPDSVTTIGDNLFRECTSLESVTIGAGLNYIGKSMFANCSALTDFTIPDNVNEIGESAFLYCTSLSDITIPEGVTSIASYAFCGCSGFTSIAIPEGVTTIGSSAFSSCSGLTSFTIPENVTSVGADAFYNCENLETLYWNATNCIQAGAVESTYTTGVLFYGCSKLSTVIIGDNVKTIGKYTFRNCYTLTSITIPESVTSIGEQAFENCELTSITIPNGVKSIGNQAFRNCRQLADVSVADSVIGVGKQAFDNTEWYNNQPNGIVYVGKVAYIYKGVVPANTDLIIADGTKGVADSAFAGASIVSVTLPQSLEYIGEHAFGACSKLTSVTIPEGIKSIGKQAFNSCDKLVSVYYEGDIASWCEIEGLGSLTTLGISIYIDNAELSGELVIPDSVTSIKDSAFYGCTNITGVAIGNGVTSIGDAAFTGCANITSVTIGSGVKTIGINTFKDCKKLTSIVIPNGVTFIGWSAFEDCVRLTDVTISDSVTIIDNSAFEGCVNLANITLGSGITSIGYRAFADCKHVDRVNYRGDIASWCAIEGLNNLPKGSTYIDNKELSGVLIIPEGVTSISNSAFYACNKLTSVIISDGVMSIKGVAFYFCTSLTSVLIPDSVTTIEGAAFNECWELTTVYFGGTQEDWENVSIGDGNGYLTNATAYFYSDVEPTSDGNYWHFATDGVTPEIW